MVIVLLTRSHLKSWWYDHIDDDDIVDGDIDDGDIDGDHC